jgi:hypothetical protein
MKASARMLKETDGLLVLPASTAGLLALINQHNIEHFPVTDMWQLLRGNNLYDHYYRQERCL